MADAPHSRKLAAILAADVAGYSRLMAADESATVAALNEGRAVFRERIAAHDGRLIDTAGDSVLATFPSVVEAVQCAVEVQKALKDKNESVPEDRRMQVRIGVNLGDVIEQADGTIYGDGVNVAARLEALAAPGEVAISDDAHRQVMRKLELGFQDIGEHEVKNIPDPVHAYRVLPEGVDLLAGAGALCGPTARKRTRFIAGAAVVVLVIAGVAAWQLTQPPTSDGPSALDEPSAPVVATEMTEGPSIAVLPFTNFSGDAGQEYFVDGMTEAIISGLSRVPELLVISRGTSFTYKGRSVQIDEVGRELGVRYVMEGSVQKAGDQVRITAQLIDTMNDSHVWSKQFDRALTDVFALQDEVTNDIVSGMETTLGSDVVIAATRPPTQNMDAYDVYLKGIEKFRVTTSDANEEARRLFEAAVALDLDFAAAYAGLGWTHLRAWILQWSRDPNDLERARELALRAVEIDPTLSEGHQALAQVHLWNREYDEARASAQTAIDVEPNGAEGFRALASIQNFDGRPQDAVQASEQARRRDPSQDWLDDWALGHARLLMNDLDGAQAALTSSIARNPNFLPSHAYLSVIYFEKGDTDAASEALARATALSPQISIDRIALSLPYSDATVLDRMVTAWRSLGLS